MLIEQSTPSPTVPQIVQFSSHCDTNWVVKSPALSHLPPTSAYYETEICCKFTNGEIKLTKFAFPLYVFQVNKLSITGVCGLEHLVQLLILQYPFDFEAIYWPFVHYSSTLY